LGAGHLRIVHHLHSFRFHGPFSTWVFRHFGVEICDRFRLRKEIATSESTVISFWILKVCR
jgi:DNA-directed RNA polymerase specialized sigma24 family protein